MAGKTEEVMRDHGQPYHAMALLAHELRSPLSAISMALQVLRRGHDDASKREHLENLLDRQTRHMSRLIEGVLDLSRIGHSKVEPNRQRVDVAQLVEASIETVRPSIKDRGHELAVCSLTWSGDLGGGSNPADRGADESAGERGQAHTLSRPDRIEGRGRGGRRRAMRARQWDRYRPGDVAATVVTVRALR